jgi:hypothetical protein
VNSLLPLMWRYKVSKGVFFAYFVVFVGMTAASADCRNDKIPKLIDEYMRGSPELQARPRSGKWIALDKVIDEHAVRAAYDCISETMLETYQRSKLDVPNIYRKWLRANEVSFYAPANDFGWANVFLNKKSEKYKINKYTSNFLPGSTIVKESFVFDISGNISVGPLFYMIKMEKGFNDSSNDWKFVEVNLDGTYAETLGINSDVTRRCIRCHGKRRETDFLFFIKNK